MKRWGWQWWGLVLGAIATFALVIACQPQETAPGTEAEPATEAPVFLIGTGADFPFFLYERIFSEYRQVAPNVQVNYQPTGSAAGIQQVLSETVDFGGSDIAMTDEEMAQVARGVVLVPMASGLVSIVYNLPNLEGQLRLSRAALTDIFLGKITQWNDAAIAASNPDLTLPDLPIILVHRSDGSGTTAVVTAHFSAVNPEWEVAVGTGLNVNWPAGVGVKANAGVGAQVQQAEGAIGYVEYGYAKKLGIPTAAVENKAGQFVAPSPETGAKGLGDVELPENLRVFVPDPEAADAYPIVTYSWILAYQRYDDPAKAAALKNVLTWGLREGQKFSEELGYVPLPPETLEKGVAAIATIQ
jgi:phosphate transport system substrate-binding protein